MALFSLPMSDGLEDVRQVFLAEALEDLSTLETSVLALERSPRDAEALAVLFRKLHALKGNADMVELPELARFAHHVEDALAGLRGGQDTFSPRLAAYLLRVIDVLRTAVPAVLEGAPLPEVCEQLAEGPDAADPGSAGSEEGGTARAQTLRIGIERLDQLLSLTSEIAIARGRLGHVVARQGNGEVAGAFRTVERLLTELHHFVTSVRLVPIRPLLHPFTRAIRDLARAEEKEVELIAIDGGVEVDTSVVEELKAPLTQLLRNAVHHGIEPPDVRERAGKPRTGRIEIRAGRESGGIVIEVSDDGAGLDEARILDRARELGLVDPDRPLSREDLHRLIFRQGLSTSRVVSQTSGRGVGMDVVLKNLDALGGDVQVKTEPGKGTRFTIRMPLTLAIIDGLVVEAEGETFVVPMGDVVRCGDLADFPGVGGGVVPVEGRAVPLLRLSSLFGGDGREEAARVLVLMEHRGEGLGLCVDRLVGKAQVIVKPAGPFFEGLATVSGMTILGDGQVAPILDISGLAEARAGSPVHG